MSRVKSIITFCLVAAVAVAAAGSARAVPQYPRDIVATAEVKTEQSSLTSRVTIHVERLMREADHERLLAALKQGGYQAFLPLFRKLAVVGYVELEQRRVDLRYARVQTTDTGERLILATDGPLYFVSGGAPDAKPRGGYALSIIDLQFDAEGGATGTMAAAARVKPGPDGSVVVDDYAEAPIRLTATGR